MASLAGKAIPRPLLLEACHAAAAGGGGGGGLVVLGPGGLPLVRPSAGRGAFEFRTLEQLVGDPALLDLLRRALDVDPATRIRAKHAAAHPYLAAAGLSRDVADFDASDRGARRRFEVGEVNFLI